ncbi:hypothetical protein ACN6MY_07370 [Peribacillus sp. B-H-3]|uniref:hypothetical protein n=1 Tax=Peribacillus sp. B-H-3 TaxID=3400420 RepID=UPI003B01CD33
MILSILMASCSKEGSNEVKNEGDKIIVQNRSGKNDEYEQLREITDKASVEIVKDILDNIRWVNAKVSMVHPAEYKFCFAGKNEKFQSITLIYELWISPNKDKVELVIDSESKYVQLDKNKSQRLFKLLTGESLSGLK